MFHRQKPCYVISNLQEPSFRKMYIDYKVTFSDIRKEVTQSQSIKKFLIFLLQIFFDGKSRSRMNSEKKKTVEIKLKQSNLKMNW